MNGYVKRNKNVVEFTPEKSKKIALARLDLLNQWKKFRRKSDNKLQADYDYLFKGRNGENKPISRVIAYMIINQACKKAHITDNVGTHTLRKTFGYHHYQTFHDVAILQYLLNHSSPSITLRYIGITQDNVEDTLKQFEL